MILIRATIIYVLFVHSLAFSLDLCALTLAAVQYDYVQLASLRNEIRSSVYQREHTPTPLKAQLIERIEETSGRELGLLNKGIYRVFISGKPFILKIRTKYKDMDGQEVYQEGNSIHEILGQMGLAPKIKGLLNPAEMRALAQSFPPLFRQDSVTGLVMEEIPNAWNPKNTLFAQGKTPGWVKSLNFSKIDFRLTQLRRTITAMGIDPQDLQVFITPDSKVVLGDLDLYKMKDAPKSKVYLDLMQYFFSELSSDIKKFISQE